MSDSQDRRGGLSQFFILLGLMAAINVALSFIAVPREATLAIGIAIGVLFLVAPIVAIYRGSDHPWTPTLALGFVGAGAVIQIVAGVVVANGWASGAPAAAISAIGQMGLMIWCIGLGALLATKAIREPNLLIPVSVFLIAFDILLVLTPVGTVQHVLKAAPKVFTSMAYKVPAVSDRVTLGPVGAAAHIGPADFLFLAMFFVAMFRFGMNAKATVFALVPTLLLYMGAVFMFGPLPALPPIALCFLIANAPHFKLKRDEWIATGVLTLILAVIIGAISARSKSRPELLPPANDGGVPRPTNLPPPASVVQFL